MGWVGGRVLAGAGGGGGRRPKSVDVGTRCQKRRGGCSCPALTHLSSMYLDNIFKKLYDDQNSVKSFYTIKNCK